MKKKGTITTATTSAKRSEEENLSSLKLVLSVPVRYPLEVIATASSSALLNERKKSGIKIGTSFFARSNRPPVSKSIPLDFWALMILCASSKRIGMNLKVSIIIIAKSLTGILKRDRGDRTFFTAVVSSIGVVVRVSIDESTMMKNILKVTMMPFVTPSVVMSTKPIGNGGMECPGVKKKWARAAKRKSHIKGMIPLNTNLMDIFDIVITRSVIKPIRVNLIGASIKKTDTINTNRIKNFTLGSKR